MNNCPSCPLPEGTRECECTVCGEHFSTPRNFDVHRKDGECRNPARIGLVVSERRPGARVWTMPADEDAVSRLRSSSQAA